MWAERATRGSKSKLTRRGRPQVSAAHRKEGSIMTDAQFKQLIRLLKQIVEKLEDVDVMLVSLL